MLLFINGLIGIYKSTLHQSSEAIVWLVIVDFISMSSYLINSALLKKLLMNLKFHMHVFRV